MKLDLSPAQFQTLAGLLDQAIKAIGIRAFEDDVADLMRTIKEAAAQPPEPAEQDDSTRNQSEI